LDSESSDDPPQPWDPPQNSVALIILIARNTCALLYQGLVSYWQLILAARSWPERLLAYSPILLAVYVAVAFSGLIKA
jgi:hypothetical protein